MPALDLHPQRVQSQDEAVHFRVAVAEGARSEEVVDARVDAGVVAGVEGEGLAKQRGQVLAVVHMVRKAKGDVATEESWMCERPEAWGSAGAEGGSQHG